jgi:hypothetical protein
MSELCLSAPYPYVNAEELFLLGFGLTLAAPHVMLPAIPLKTLHLRQISMEKSTGVHFMANSLMVLLLGRPDAYLFLQMS